MGKKFNITGTETYVSEINYNKQFICRIDKELLDLGAVEIDKTLKKLIPENEDKINIKIDNLVSKSFKIDRIQNVITGRGIKGFFKNIKNQNAIAA
ncbi:hypothetical protein [Clostridium tyrobutyricum]|nr:hypothetical protein [Clostridium tyrobutyricum]MEA5010040.1 hypothetical protein [Clostridium tyrobutyricum]